MNGRDLILFPLSWIPISTGLVCPAAWEIGIARSHCHTDSTHLAAGLFLLRVLLILQTIHYPLGNWQM